MFASKQLSTVESNIDKIEWSHEIEIRGSKFSCAAAYLGHEIHHPPHKYVNQPSLKELQRQQLQKQLEIDHAPAGPRL